MIASRPTLVFPMREGITAPDNLPTMQSGTAMGSSGLPRVPQPGMFDRIRGFVGSDLGKATLLRSGIATLRGGIGEGLAAGAQFVDQRHAQEHEDQQEQFRNTLLQNKLVIDAHEAAAKTGAVHYQVVPEGGRLVGMYGNGSLVDPSQANAATAAPPSGGAMPAAPASASLVPQITSAIDYNRLPPGSEYLTPTGERRRKGGAPSQGSGGFPGPSRIY